MRPSSSGRPGRWFLALLMPMLSPASGCTPSSTILMAPSLATWRVSWLVARGFSQAYGLDYHETFSLVARLSSIRVLFSLALDQYWPLHQLDVSNAFLYGDLDEQVFMEQPPGYVAQGESSEVCLLKKAIYGLKQSPRAWFHKFSQLLFSYGFVSTVSDPTVMWKRTPHGCVILAVYVDDITITGSDDAEVTATKAYLAQHFITRDLSPPRYFLGLEIAYRQG